MNYITRFPQNIYKTVTFITDFTLDNTEQMFYNKCTR